MSNPSLAQYHLNKPRELGLISESNGEYEIAGEVKVDVMRDFLRHGKLMQFAVTNPLRGIHHTALRVLVLRDRGRERSDK